MIPQKNSIVKPVLITDQTEGLSYLGIQKYLISVSVAWPDEPRSERRNPTAERRSFSAEERDDDFYGSSRRGRLGPEWGHQEYRNR